MKPETMNENEAPLEAEDSVNEESVAETAETVESGETADAEVEAEASEAADPEGGAEAEASGTESDDEASVDADDEGPHVDQAASVAAAEEGEKSAAEDEDAAEGEDTTEDEEATEGEDTTEGEDSAESAAVAEGEDEEEDEDRLPAAIEAILFTSEIPLTAKRLGEITQAKKNDVLEAIDALNLFYADSKRAFQIAPIAGGHQLVTTNEHAATLAKLHKEKVPTRLSRAALETLSIIAFKQPVTRAEIDAIRGVSASDRVLRHLIDRKLVKIAGRAEAPGRPLLYGTTREFLAYFGLSQVHDLPRTEELNSLLAGETPNPATMDEEIQERLKELEPETTEEGQESPPETVEGAMMEGEPAGVDSPLPQSHSGEESDDDGAASP